MKKIISLSSLCGKYLDDIVEIPTSTGFSAIEWDLNYIPPTLNVSRIQSLKNSLSVNGIDVRYHLPYSYIEIGHANSGIRNYSMSTVTYFLDFIKLIGGTVAIIHVGYCENSSFHETHRNLKKIADYAQTLGISVCVENLVKGLTTSITNLKAFTEIDNVYLCLDTGHAQVVESKSTGFCDKLRTMIETVLHSHVYYSEDSKYNHIAFDDNTFASSKLFNALVKSSCPWFTMELDTKTEQLCQAKKMEAYLLKTLT